MLLLAALFALAGPTPAAVPPGTPATIELGRHEHTYGLKLYPDGTAYRTLDRVPQAAPLKRLNAELVARFFADANDPATNFGIWDCDGFNAKIPDNYAVKYINKIAYSGDCGPIDKILKDARAIMDAAWPLG